MPARPRTPPTPARERFRVVKVPLTPAQEKAKRIEDRKKFVAQQKADFLTALERSLGLITHACRASGVQHCLYTEWYEGDLSFRAEVDRIRHMQVDFVEGQLMKQIKGDANNRPDTRAICFYLSYKGGPNGYNAGPAKLQAAPPQTMALPSNNPEATEAAADRSEMDDEALMAAIRIAEKRQPGVFGAKPKQVIMEADMVPEEKK